MSQTTMDPRLLRAPPKRKLRLSWADERVRGLVWQVLVVGLVGDQGQLYRVDTGTAKATVAGPSSQSSQTAPMAEKGTASITIAVRTSAAPPGTACSQARVDSMRIFMSMNLWRTTWWSMMAVPKVLRWRAQSSASS